MASDLTRVHVNLIRPAYEALTALMQMTGHNQTNVINRALQVYRFIEDTRAGGGEVLVRDSGGQLMKVGIL